MSDTIDQPTDQPTDLDPFEAFNRAAGSEALDPYPNLALLRTQGHVVPLDLGDLGAGEVEMPAVLQAISYDAVHEVLKDGNRFSSSGYAEVMGKVMGRTILEMDEPEHHAYRSILQKAFTRKAMEHWEEALVRPTVDRLLDDIEGAGRAELVRSLLFPFPVHVIAGLLGLPDEHLDEFHRLAVELISILIDESIALRAAARLEELLIPIIRHRRDHPGDDMISVLATAEHEGRHLTDVEIVSFCRLLLPAGAETTYRSSSNLFCGLLLDPAQLDAVRADRSLLPAAVEEGLRWEPPLLTIFRTAAVDTEVCGVPVAAGAAIMTHLGSANRDEARWTDPDRFDIHRAPQGHIAFATGPHLCLGLHLARMETKVVVERTLDRLPDLRLDPDAPPPHITGTTFRAPQRIDVCFG